MSKVIDVYEAAKTLGILITESKEFLEFQKIQDDIENYEQDRQIYLKYKQYKEILSKQESSQQQLTQLEKEARENIKINDLLDKEANFQHMLEKVKAVIEHYAGEIFSNTQDKQCGSGCSKSSKGGCCKK